jgi:hypothetical protein
MTMLISGGPFVAAVALMGLLAACSHATPPNQADKLSMQKFVFLTRQGCVNTATMRENFDAALKAVGWSSEYQFLDADTLAPMDPRGGYGTPTILYDGHDLFDMPEPAVSHPAPT